MKIDAPKIGQTSSTLPNQEAFPWAEIMRFGFGVLGLSSKDFWAMTPLEISAAMKAYMPSANAPQKTSLEELMLRFPDINSQPQTS